MILNINEYSNDDFYLRIEKLLPNIKEGYFCESVEMEKNDSLLSILSHLFPNIIKNNICINFFNNYISKRYISFIGSLNTQSEIMSLNFGISNTNFSIEINSGEYYLNVKNYQNPDLEFNLFNEKIIFKLGDQLYHKEICSNVYKLISLCFYGDNFFNRPERDCIKSVSDVDCLLSNIDLHFNYILIDEIIAY